MFLVLLLFCSTLHSSFFFLFFFFNDTATTEIYTLSLHDALPISLLAEINVAGAASDAEARAIAQRIATRSEEHTSELQSRRDLVCRLLLEKKKKITHYHERFIRCNQTDVDCHISCLLRLGPSART